jgi:antitoxin component YwqK of YwqJK toxin-antitoxin module
MRVLKIRQLFVLGALLFLFLINGNAQYKTFQISEKGDTINAVDKNDKKQGKWVIRVEEVRGEPGYEEEGVFKNDKKEGVWRLYNLTGDLIGVENYKLGGKDGIQQYYTYLGDLYREESWRGYNPDAPYDTIPVYGTGNGEIVDYKIIKAEQYSVKHGLWKYFDPGSGRLIKSEKYDRGFLEKPEGQTPPAATNTNVDKAKKPDKTPEMLQWEKKNKGKKNALRDGRTGT